MLFYEKNHNLTAMISDDMHKKEEFQFNAFLCCWIMLVKSQFILHMICNLSSFVHFYRMPLQCFVPFQEFLIIFDCLWRSRLSDKFLERVWEWKKIENCGSLCKSPTCDKFNISNDFMLIKTKFHNFIYFCSFHMIDDFQTKLPLIWSSNSFQHILLIEE